MEMCRHGGLGITRLIAYMHCLCVLDVWTKRAVQCRNVANINESNRVMNHSVVAENFEEDAEGTADWCFRRQVLQRLTNLTVQNGFC